MAADVSEADELETSCYDAYVKDLGSVPVPLWSLDLYISIDILTGTPCDANCFLHDWSACE